MRRLSKVLLFLSLSLSLASCGGGNNPDMAIDMASGDLRLSGDLRSSGDLSTAGDLSAAGDLNIPADMTNFTAEQACTDLATALCQKQSSCTATTGITRTWGTLAVCEAQQKLACMDRLAAPGTTNTPDVTEACAMAYPAAACRDYFLGIVPTACATGKTATGADNSVCIGADQCLHGFCQYTDGSACGACGAPPAVGASCNTTDCAAGQYCLGPAGAKTCQIPVVMIGACSTDNQCLPDLSCQGYTAKTMGMCEPSLGKAGDVCDPAQQTTAGCDDRLGLYCNATSKKCTAVTYVAAGQPCGALANGTVAGCIAGECDIATGATMGTCKAFLADGAACSLTTGPACLGPDRCVVKTGQTTGTCQTPDAALCK